jgi:hypothetical protein
LNKKKFKPGTLKKKKKTFFFLTLSNYYQASKLKQAILIFEHRFETWETINGQEISETSNQYTKQIKLEIGMWG